MCITLFSSGNKQKIKGCMCVFLHLKSSSHALLRQVLKNNVHDFKQVDLNKALNKNKSYFYE